MLSSAPADKHERFRGRTIRDGFCGNSTSENNCLNHGVPTILIGSTGNE